MWNNKFFDLYPDLFSGVGTIKNAIVHLDVKPGAVPVLCSPHHVPHTVQPKLKEELDSVETWSHQKVGYQQSQ